VHTDFTASCAWTIIEAATPAEIDRVFGLLAGHEPIAVRFDDVGTTVDPEWS
jgi:hypothetical protein